MVTCLKYDAVGSHLEVHPGVEGLDAPVAGVQAREAGGEGLGMWHQVSTGCST